MGESDKILKSLKLRETNSDTYSTLEWLEPGKEKITVIEVEKIVEEYNFEITDVEYFE